MWKRNEFKFNAQYGQAEAEAATVAIVTIEIGIDNSFVKNGYDFECGATTAPAPLPPAITTGINFHGDVNNSVFATSMFDNLNTARYSTLIKT